MKGRTDDLLARLEEGDAYPRAHRRPTLAMSEMLEPGVGSPVQDSLILRCVPRAATGTEVSFGAILDSISPGVNPPGPNVNKRRVGLETDPDAAERRLKQARCSEHNTLMNTLQEMHLKYDGKPSKPIEDRYALSRSQRTWNVGTSALDRSQAGLKAMSTQPWRRGFLFFIYF